MGRGWAPSPGAAGCTCHRPDGPCCSPGQEVAIYDGRPNGELLLATGTMEPGNPAGAHRSPARAPLRWPHALALTAGTSLHATPAQRPCCSLPLLPPAPCRLPVHGDGAGCGGPAVHHQASDPGDAGPGCAGWATLRWAGLAREGRRTSVAGPGGRPHTADQLCVRERAAALARPPIQPPLRLCAAAARHAAGPREQFPITEDRITTQHLVYLRMARLQDPAQLAKVRAPGGPAGSRAAGWGAAAACLCCWAAGPSVQGGPCDCWPARPPPAAPTCHPPLPGPSVHPRRALPLADRL